MEELELRHIVLLCGSLARAACSDGKGQDDGRRHEELELHSGRAGVEQTAVLHAHPEHERRGADETAERARGEGAEAWKAFWEHYEPKTATRYVGMLRQILLYDFGELTQLIDRIEQFRHLVRKYTCGRPFSRLASRTRRSGTIWRFMQVYSTPSIRWQLRCRPFPGPGMRMTLCQWASLCKAKGKDGKDKSESKSSRTRSVSTVTKIGHVKADCRKKKRDDEERKTTLAQNSLTSSSDATSPPGTDERTSEHVWSQRLVSPTTHCPVPRLG